jgi:ribosomal protein L16 Arg81 hydroxylase
MEPNLLTQIPRYVPQDTEADLRNLDSEVADEDALNTTLINSDAAAQIAVVRAFVADNADLIRSQHARMLAGSRRLRDMIAANKTLESTDAELKALLASEPVRELAQLLTEMNAMSQQYHDLLIETGRAGRPPLF